MLIRVTNHVDTKGATRAQTKVLDENTGEPLALNITRVELHCDAKDGAWTGTVMVIEPELDALVEAEIVRQAPELGKLLEGCRREVAYHKANNVEGSGFTTATAQLLAFLAPLLAQAQVGVKTTEAKP